jgi:5S rRNA maturation endonuclease (ribonuclease M5)
MLSPYSDRRFLPVVQGLVEVVHDLNVLSKEGGVLLVEGKRDLKAMRSIGYKGRIITTAELRNGVAPKSLTNVGIVIILTDFDREGRHLASRYTRQLRNRGVRSTLVFRRRLISILTKEQFFHIENLVRFAGMMPDLEGT